MDKEETAKLLNEAADDLEALKLPERAGFDMSEWGCCHRRKKPTLSNLCGTRACAAGWLSLAPKWRRRGFLSEWRGSERFGWELVASPFHQSWEIMASQVFGTSRQEMEHIFMATNSDRAEVVVMFRDLAKEYQHD